MIRIVHFRQYKWDKQTKLIGKWIELIFRNRKWIVVVSRIHTLHLIILIKLMMDSLLILIKFYLFHQAKNQSSLIILFPIVLSVLGSKMVLKRFPLVLKKIFQIWDLLILLRIQKLIWNCKTQWVQRSRNWRYIWISLRIKMFILSLSKFIGI